MRNLLYMFPVVAGIALVGSARAADMPAPILEAIPDEVVFQPMNMSWDGLFAGIHAGYSGSDNSANVLGGVAQAFDDDSYALGGQIGYDFGRDKIVIGIVGDFSALGNEASTNGFGPLGIYSEEVEWLATARGRIGLAFENVMPFVSGGAALAGLDTSLGGISNSETRTGWTAGGGIEFALGNGLTLGGEYLYVDLGEERNIHGGTIIESNLAVHVVRANLNYRFSY